MLTSTQLSAIDYHLRNENWLLNEELIVELTDHYVAGIENRLAHGTNFDVAMREVYAGFGGRKGLLQLEEDFQTQKSRQINLEGYRELKTFFLGKRLPVLLGLFSAFYGLNTVINPQTKVFGFLTLSDFLLLILIWLVGPLSGTARGWKNDKRDPGDSAWSYLTLTSLSLIRVYVICYVFLFGSKFLISYLDIYLTAPLLPGLITISQAVIVTYAIASIITLRKLGIEKTQIAW